MPTVICLSSFPTKIAAQKAYDSWYRTKWRNAKRRLMVVLKLLVILWRQKEEEKWGGGEGRILLAFLLQSTYNRSSCSWNIWFSICSLSYIQLSRVHMMNSHNHHLPSDSITPVGKSTALLPQFAGSWVRILFKPEFFSGFLFATVKLRTPVWWSFILKSFIRCPYDFQYIHLKRWICSSAGWRRHNSKLAGNLLKLLQVPDLFIWSDYASEDLVLFVWYLRVSSCVLRQ